MLDLLHRVTFEDTVILPPKTFPGFFLWIFSLNLKIQKLTTSLFMETNQHMARTLGRGVLQK